ncbi:MAG TPA: D-aminoacyl-tRNA deacylase [Pyrinomonadaceae bacterium]|jgi:D-tyrosyl-tRNA(Tyr) deacylase|nr:D-aminoacyl-tRNA deacylase [Pyrinomonadaceae bacterium]
MRAVLQRVTRASVRVGGETVGEIGCGLVVLVGIAATDGAQDIKYLVEKIAALRIFEDADERMNLSVKDVGGELLVVSQFTLYGDARRGRRPSWSDAAPPETAEPLYEAFIEEARRSVGRVETGSFRRMMEVELVNDGPVTILLDSRRLF